jgi:hypothetical protein
MNFSSQQILRTLCLASAAVVGAATARAQELQKESQPAQIPIHVVADPALPRFLKDIPALRGTTMSEQQNFGDGVIGFVNLDYFHNPRSARYVLISGFDTNKNTILDADEVTFFCASAVDTVARDNVEMLFASHAPDGTFSVEKKFKIVDRFTGRTKRTTDPVSRTLKPDAGLDGWVEMIADFMPAHIQKPRTNNINLKTL